MRRLRDLAIVTLVMAIGIWFFGWWSIPVVAAILAIWHRRGRTALVLGVFAVILSSLILLGIQALFGSNLREFDSDLALSLGVPPMVPLLLTVIVPVLLVITTVGTIVMAKQLRRRSGPGTAVSAQ
jgi:hypothetical protein